MRTRASERARCPCGGRRVADDSEVSAGSSDPTWHTLHVSESEAERAARAARRRATWTFGVAHGFDEMTKADLEFWARATPAERIRGLTELIFEMSWIRGEHEPPARLLRSVFGVRPRGG